MHNGDDGGLGPHLEQRLRDELDAIEPRFSSPRYQTVRRLPVVLRAAPAVLAATVLAMVGLTAYAGSPNPEVVIEKVVNIIHPPAASPAPEASPGRQPQSPAPSATPEHHQSPEPSEKPEPNESQEPSGSPGASDGGSKDGGGTSSDGGSSGTSDGGSGGTSDGGSGGTSDGGSGH